MGVLVASLGASACTRVQTPRPAATSMRSERDQYGVPVLDAPPVADLLAACDVLARDLVLAETVQNSPRPLVIQIKPFENATRTNLDLLIIPQTIRAKIMESGSAKIAFRDDSSRADILEERANQSEQPRSYQQESTIRRPAGPTGVGRPLSENTSTTTEVTASGTVPGQIARVDYFLFGKIYAQDEKSGRNVAFGMRYYQFHAWLTDARTGLIVWEKVYRVKREGFVSRAETAGPYRW